MGKASNFIDRYLSNGSEPVPAAHPAASSTATAASAATAPAAHAGTHPEAFAFSNFFFETEAKAATAASAADWARRRCANISDKLYGAAADTGKYPGKTVAGQAAAGGENCNRLADITF